MTIESVGVGLSVIERLTFLFVAQQGVGKGYQLSEKSNVSSIWPQTHLSVLNDELLSGDQNPDSISPFRFEQRLQCQQSLNVHHAVNVTERSCC